jgi:glutathione S-transferase
VSELPLLWSFRRCPYAMRARMAISSSGKPVRLREIVLRDKPAEFIAHSAKATVPVLVKGDEEIVDESLDIMLWALEGSDPDGLNAPLSGSRLGMLDLVARCESEFKPDLDAYKYAIDGDESGRLAARGRALTFLEELDTRLQTGANLFGDRLALADVAIFPFVRQFAGVDPEWFAGVDLPALQTWLEKQISSQLFAGVMTKYPPWANTREEFLFPDA